MSAYDVAVVGLGVAGASAAWRLAQRGARVIGLDRFAPPHPFGSSHGRTRIIRRAYFEGDVYIPLLRRAYAGWRELERVTGERLLRETGGLNIGPAGGAIPVDARTHAERHGIEVELLDAEAVRRRFPQFHLRPGEVASYEPGAGILAVEPAVAALLEAARAAGAELRFGVDVLRCEERDEEVRLRTAAGDYTAERAVLAAGPWLARVAPPPAPPLEVERSVVCWFAPDRPGRIEFDGLPVFIHEFEPGRVWYGVPEEGALKVGLHHGGERADIDALRREVDALEITALARRIAELLPDALGAAHGARVCPYTNTPDGHFLLDHHPTHRRIVLVSACSGHGFKFGPALGEAVAGLALGGDLPGEWRTFGWRW